MSRAAAQIQAEWLRRGWAVDDLLQVDVGATGGVPNTFGIPASRWRTIAFEPDARGGAIECAGSKMTVFLTALAERDGFLKLHLTRAPKNTSAYPPNSAWRRKFNLAERMDVEREVTIPARALDNLSAEHEELFGYGGGVDYLKLDTQGSELDILRGGTNVLTTTFAVELEVEFIEHYTGQPLFADVDVFLRDRGFLLFDIAPIYWKRKIGSGYGGIRCQLVHGNALFLRETSAFLRALEKAALPPEIAAASFYSKHPALPLLPETIE